MTPKELCSRVRVIPVLVVEELEHAVPMARALAVGGLSVLEVTLRSACALDAIQAMREAVPEATVGAGTVLTPADVKACQAAGARFAVSPGATPALLDAVEESGLPLLPGAATPTEIMALGARGYDTLKFFPAEAAGGVAMLKALAGPLPGMAFCPTGGISPANAPDYLALPNVLCVGGSWVVPKDTVARGDWPKVAELAREATLLG
jgi:2-dehydro-3-deoxyphosphogluconate aldolase/(4S)-4-hydroxy-2-oxoglutarate aldolase